MNDVSMRSSNPPPPTQLPCYVRRGDRYVEGDPATASKYVYNTEDVYTFDYYQSVLLFDSYCLDIGIVKLNLERHLNGQPLGIMAGLGFCSLALDVCALPFTAQVDET